MSDSSQPSVAAGALRAGALAFALVALLAFAPAAGASPDPVAGGSVKLTFKKGFVNSLRKQGVKIVRAKPATLKGRQATLPVSGGSVDPLTGQGTVTLAGGLNFKAGKRRAQVRALSIDTAKKGLFAKVAGKRMRFASLAGISFSRDGFGTRVTVKRLKLTGSVAARLNKKLRHGKRRAPVKANRLMAGASVAAQPSTVAIQASGNATLALSPAAVSKIAGVGTPPYPAGESPVAVKLEPLPPTSVLALGPPPTVAFPVVGGSIAPDASTGTIQHAGGLRLVQNLEGVSKVPGDVTTLTLSNIWVDLGTRQATVEVTIANPVRPEANLGSLGRVSIADINLAGASVTPDPAGRTIAIANASATLQAVTAETLNEVFINGLEKASPLFAGQTKFAAGDPLGTFSVTVQTQ